MRLDHLFEAIGSSETLRHLSKAVGAYIRRELSALILGPGDLKGTAAIFSAERRRAIRALRLRPRCRKFDLEFHVVLTAPSSPKFTPPAA
jgi:hypothetical protein